MTQRITENLRAAINTMRDACDDAERMSRNGDARAVRAVLHSLSWGMANASTSIECAMAALEDAHEERVSIALRDGK
jgi:hypothetical protein